MERLFGVLLILGLAACDRAAESAEEQIEMVSRHGSEREKCQAAGKAAQAWLEREHVQKYEQWRLTRDIHCSIADLGG